MGTSDEVLDLGGYPEVYADDVTEIQHLSGNNRRIIFGAWQRVGGVYRRVVVAALIRPAGSLMTGVSMFEAAARPDANPAATMITALPLH